MSDLYGGLVIGPVPPLPPSGSFPEEVGIGDPLLGYVGDFLRTIMTAYIEVAWRSVAPGYPIVKTLLVGDPEDGFSEEYLPALYVYRPGRETREQVEEFETVADDYRFEKSRISVQWIMPAAPQEHRRQRDEIINAIRKVIDKAILIGRDPAWIVPGDTDSNAANYDAKAATFGSSLSKYAGFATLELQRASPSAFVRRMEPPAKHRTYKCLKMSLYLEELLQRDIEVGTDPHDQLDAEYQSPDQGTGLGPLTVGEAEYT